MEKKLRLSIDASAEEFISSAEEIDVKLGKSTLKTLIWNIKSSSNLSSTLPGALATAVDRSSKLFKKNLESGKESFVNIDIKNSPQSPPTKRVRRSSRNKNHNKETGTDELKENVPRKGRNLLTKLHIYASIARFCISHPEKIFSTYDLLPSVQMLHDGLILYEMDPFLLFEIASLCEEWWKGQLPCRETLISQSLPFLLSRSLISVKKVDVHRIYALREALSLFDFDDESIEDLKLLLLRCVIAPLYLKTDEGRRFVTFLLGLNGQFAKEALALIRSQIPFGKKSILETYGDILFRAWKTAEGPLIEEIENGFLQGLIEGAIHANSRSLGASIRRVLGGFINQRTVEGVEKLLFRLAEPVLFRSLQVANSNVRQNALHLLLDMFPIEDPDAKKDTKDTLLNTQFFLLEKLLVDDCPSVRNVAVEGSYRILNLFWEIIPSSIISKFLAKLIDDMSHDTCNEVRVATLNGIVFLLENPQSHEILKLLLPRLGHLFMDSVFSVRSAVGDLLLSIRDLRAFQFNKVVDLDTLLYALANDHLVIAKKITRLLIPSYFPSKVSIKEACNRCIMLIKRNPLAGARFCEFALMEGSSPKSLMELIRVITKYMLSPDGLKPDVINGFFLAASNLCHSLWGDTSCKTALREIFSGEKLKCFLNVATTGHMLTSIVTIASVICPDTSTELFEQCMNIIMDCRGLSRNVEKQEEIRAVHNLVFSCDWFDNFFEILAEILRKIVSPDHEIIPSKKRRKVKLSTRSKNRETFLNESKFSLSSIDLEEDFDAIAGVAWQIKDMLVFPNTCHAILSSSSLRLVFSSLEDLSQINIEQFMYQECLDLSPLLAYCSLAMHIFLNSTKLTSKNDIGDDACNKFDPKLFEQSTLDGVLNYLFDCSTKMFSTSETTTLNNPPDVNHNQHDETTSCRRSRRKKAPEITSKLNKGVRLKSKSISEPRRIINIVKVVTAVLKFLVDATTVKPVSQSIERGIGFASKYLQYLTAAIAKFPDLKVLLNEEPKETILCLKSSFSYMGKLLNIFLRNSNGTPSHPVLSLTSNLLNLIVSIESNLGSNQALRLVSIAKIWLPDLILALAYAHLLNQEEKDKSPQLAPIDNNLTWLTVLAKIEVREIVIEQDEVCEDIYSYQNYSAFKKLIDMMILLLNKGSFKILDAFGSLVLSVSLAALEKEEDLDIHLGLLHFVCVKLVGDDYEKWKDFVGMVSSLKNIYLKIEKNFEDQRINQKETRLHQAKEILESLRFIQG